MKEKIAISLDKPLLSLVDSKVDGAVLRSRSQAIEFFLRRGLKEESIDAAVILLKGSHQAIALKEVKGRSLIKNQISFLANYGIKDISIVTQHTKDSPILLQEIAHSPVNVEIIEKEAKGNAQALLSVKDKLNKSFLVMSGDIYNNFNLLMMIKKHLDFDKLASVGLMSIDKPSAYGQAILDGDLVVDFREKPKKMETHVVNAGIYLFKPEVFDLFGQVSSIEKDLLPKIARMKQLVGFFTHGEYMHVS